MTELYQIPKFEGLEVPTLSHSNTKREIPSIEQSPSETIACRNPTRAQARGNAEAHP
jgi:hypothetical protein